MQTASWEGWPSSDRFRGGWSMAFQALTVVDASSGFQNTTFHHVRQVLEGEMRALRGRIEVMHKNAAEQSAAHGATDVIAHQVREAEEEDRRRRARQMEGAGRPAWAHDMSEAEFDQRLEELAGEFEQLTAVTVAGPLRWTCDAVALVQQTAAELRDMLDAPEISPTQPMHPPSTQNSTQDSNDQAEANMTAADQGDARLTMARRAARQILEILSGNDAILPFPGPGGSSTD